jgi:hypothetical protein
MTSILKKADYVALCHEIKKEFSDFEIIKKEDSLLMKVINIFLMIITFGQMKVFMTKFITVIGNKVYVTESWDDRDERLKCATLRHERVHMRQSKKYGKFLFSILYLFLPFPIGIAWFRTKFEKEAYEESFRALNEYFGKEAFSDRYKKHIVGQFTTSHYFWMWPFRDSLEKWYDEKASKLRYD